MSHVSTVDQLVGDLGPRVSVTSLAQSKGELGPFGISEPMHRGQFDDSAMFVI